MSDWKKYMLLFIAVFAVDIVFSQGCSQCKLLAEQGSELDEASFGSNINYGILYLMTIPYILLFILFRKRILRLFRALLKR
tara:strand:- start:361 stop:603 length:243 start_codon:yes stop_codon:yes gene_type:complete